MSSRSEASWAGYKLVRSVLTANKEHSSAHRFDNKAEGLVVVLEEPQKITQSTRASEDINCLGIETRVLREDRFDCRFHGVLRVPRSILVSEISARVLWKLRRFRWRVPQCGHTLFDGQLLPWAALLNETYQETRGMGPWHPSSCTKRGTWCL